MGISYQSIDDTYPLASDDNVRINVSFTCAPLSKVTAADISTFLGQQQAVSAVLDVTEGWVDSITLGLSFECAYMATINPRAGVTAGDLRTAMYNAISAANATHVVQSNNVLVGLIERSTSSIIPNAPSATTTISLVAVAAIAIVGFLVFIKIE